ncbi:MAG: leucine-rich repeat domain-containing protein [Lachnospiraceae bacterium]|nr:leucine-rich repeat domain-containing protein [Lachnospiraceae bacterium]
MNYYDDRLKLYYEIRDTDGQRYAVITDADKKLNEVIIPEKIDGYPVHVIGKKAFLGCKGLRYVHLPGTVSSIGEWAFAFCDNLIRIRIPRGKVGFGKGVFKNDDKLNEIMVFDPAPEPKDMDETGSLMVSKLMAAAPVIMDAEYLLDTEHSGDPEWLRKWDTRLAHILSLKDDEGYHLYVLCGEEDLHFDYEEYLEYNREKKSSLCMLRLVNDVALYEEDKKPLREYIMEHTAGCESEAAIRVLLKRHGDDREYYRMMLDTGAIHSGNLEAVLSLMGDRHAQMKAFLMEECRHTDKDYFDDLML